MDESKLTRLVDFQSIVIEELETGDADVALDFAQEVLSELQEEVES
jgi:hypothetical protein